jgi:hypothetical protein
MLLHRRESIDALFDEPEVLYQKKEAIEAESEARLKMLETSSDNS